LPHVGQAVIHLPDESYSYLNLVAVVSEIGKTKPEHRLKVGEGLAGLAYQTRTSVYSPNVNHDPRFLPGTEPNLWQSMMVVPIRRSEHVFGTITVGATGIDALTSNDRRILEHLCDNAAMAIENARLFEYEQVQRRFAEGMSKFLSVLGRSTPRESDIFSDILSQLLSVLECRAAHLLIMGNDDSDFTVVQSCVKSDDGELIDVDNRYAETNPSILSHIKTKTTIHVANTAYLGQWEPPEGYEWVRSFAVTPLKLDNDRVGLIHVCSDVVGHFNFDRRNWLEAFAGQAAIALQNARLYQNLEESLAKEQAARDQMVRDKKLAAMGRMVASVAHELNNPLQVIRNCLYLLQVDLPSTPTVDEYLNISLSEITRLSDLVSQLREVYRSRPKASTAVSVASLLAEVCQLVQSHLVQNNVAWHWPAGGIRQDYIVYGNADQLKQVMLNLCFNAIEVMAEDGKGALFIDLLFENGLIYLRMVSCLIVQFEIPRD